jgi:hypothetical protein
LKDQAQGSYISKTFSERNNKVFSYIGTFILMAVTVSILILAVLLLINILKKSF